MARYPYRCLIDFMFPSGSAARWAPRPAEAERTPGGCPGGMAHRYRYPAPLRRGTRCSRAPSRPAAVVRILKSVADLPIPLPPLPAGLDTPELVVFVDRVRDNIERLQADLAARGVALRPHFKTHKSVRIARMQLDAGRGRA